jgi:hypothetical protein
MNCDVGDGDLIFKYSTDPFQIFPTLPPILFQTKYQRSTHIGSTRSVVKFGKPGPPGRPWEWPNPCRNFCRERLVVQCTPLSTVVFTFTSCSFDSSSLTVLFSSAQWAAAI